MRDSYEWEYSKYAWDFVKRNSKPQGMRELDPVRFGTNASAVRLKWEHKSKQREVSHASSDSVYKKIVRLRSRRDKRIKQVRKCFDWNPGKQIPFMSDARRWVFYNSLSLMCFSWYSSSSTRRKRKEDRKHKKRLVAQIHDSKLGSGFTRRTDTMYFYSSSLYCPCSVG